MKPRIVVIGLGNTLMGDEGLGVRALERLRETPAAGPVNFYDGGTRGLLLLPFMEEASHLLLLDAVQSKDPPGTVLEITGPELLSAKIPLKFSAHDIALPDLLTLFLLRGGDPGPQIHFLGITPASMDMSTDLSAPVVKAMPELLARAQRVLERWAAEIQNPVPGGAHVLGSPG